MKTSFWDLIEPNDTARWIKWPAWAASVIPKISSSASEMLVLMYLIFGTDPSRPYISIAPTSLGIEFCGNIPAKTYYRAITKFKQLGMTKCGAGVYNLEGLVNTFRILKNTPAVPVGTGEPEEKSDE